MDREIQQVITMLESMVANENLSKVFDLSASVFRTAFQSLVAVGFTEDQAVQLTVSISQSLRSN